MTGILDSEIQFLPGVGPKRAELLQKELNIYTCRDLISYYPYRHIDRTRIYKVSEVHAELPYIQLKGHILSYEKAGAEKGRKRLVAMFSDGTGVMELIWFQGYKWIPETYTTGKEYVIFGKPSSYREKVNMVHPDIDEVSRLPELSSRLQPLYITTEKLKNNYITSKTIQKLIRGLLNQISHNIPENLPSWLLTKAGLIPLKDALHTIHFPEKPEDLKKAEYRLKFEELFFIQLNLLKTRLFRDNKLKGYVFPVVGLNFNTFYNENLPFELTSAQKKVMKEIRKDMGSGKQMNRLLQGDVGSGKTLVALMSMLIALDNGFQSVLMAPTEILANQHYQTISVFLKGMNVKVALLTGSTRKKERMIIDQTLGDGSLHILIGTHALIEDWINIPRLGLVVIDEQHRFGVAQRARLWSGKAEVPHVLVMTATPIPRTLAMTLYGDLDVSVIDTLPPGRKPIKTFHVTDSKRLRMHGFIREQINAGRQVYIVYPLIKESEKMDYKDLEDGYSSIVAAFPPPRYQVGVVHGKMKPADKEFSMKMFKDGKTNILVATTVIEVGVDVPNASVMVIESAERFGLSQLHQLRGRVGRGADQSFCVLMSGYKLSDDARKRLEIMVRTNDGFEIAEADLRLRGPGDMEGTQQSGMPYDLRIANLGQDGQILQFARDLASDLLQKDPALNRPENHVLLAYLRKYFKKSFDWSMVS